MEAACSPIPPGKCSGRDFPATRPEPGFTQAAALAGWDEAELQSLAELSISPMNPNQQQQPHQGGKVALMVPALPGSPAVLDCDLRNQRVPLSECSNTRRSSSSRKRSPAGSSKVEIIDLTSPDPPLAPTLRLDMSLQSSVACCSAVATTQTTPRGAVGSGAPGAGAALMCLSAGRAKQLREEFECSICYELYDNPTSLECGGSL